MEKLMILLLLEFNNQSTYVWTTDASNGTSGWSATNTEDITVTTSAAATSLGIIR